MSDSPFNTTSAPTEYQTVLQGWKRAGERAERAEAERDEAWQQGFQTGLVSGRGEKQAELEAERDEAVELLRRVPLRPGLTVEMNEWLVDRRALLVRVRLRDRST